MKKTRILILWLIIVLVAITVTFAGCSSGGDDTAAPSADPSAAATLNATETATEVPPKKETVTVRVSIPVDWITAWDEGSAASLWAWKEGGEDAFEAWPGEALVPDDYGWFTTTVPGWVDRLVISGLDGTVQTADLTVDAGYDLWILVYDDLAVDIFYEDIFSDFEYSEDDIYVGALEGMEDDPFVQAALAEDFETMKELLPTIQDRSILTDWAFNDFNYWYASEAVRTHDYATAIEFFDYCAYEDNRNYARIFEHLVAGDVEGAIDILIPMGFTMLDHDLDMEWSQIIQEAAGLEIPEGSVDEILWDRYMTRRMWANQPYFTENSLVFGEHSTWEAEGHIGEIQDGDYYLPVGNLNALYAQCGSEANGKILVIRSQKSYPKGTTYYAIDLLVMEYLGYDLYPANLAEVEYIIEVNYDYASGGSYKETISSQYGSTANYFEFLRMKGQVVLKEAVGSKIIQQSQWIQGTGEVQSHLSDQKYQCSNMPETGADIISAVEAVRQRNAE